MTTPHPYYVAHARKILADLAMPPAAATAAEIPLAATAQFAAGQDHPPHGVLIAADGRILGSTYRANDRIGAVYASNKLIRDHHLTVQTADAAAIAIGHDLGVKVVHLPLSKFSGPSPTRV